MSDTQDNTTKDANSNCFSISSSPISSQDKIINITSKKNKNHRSKFTDAEDNLLRIIIAQTGTDNWQKVAARMGQRTARQCRDRWKHYLSPMTNTTEWTMHEDRILVDNYRILGPHWGRLATLFPGRTSVGVRNRCCKLLRIGNMAPPAEINFLNDNNCGFEQNKVMLPPISSLPFPKAHIQHQQQIENSFNIHKNILPTDALPNFLLSLSPNFLLNVQ